MNETRVRDLAALALVAAVVLFLGAELLDSDRVRQPPVGLVVTITLGAVITFAVGRSLAVRLSGRPGSKPILPIAVARLAALGIATALSGALIGGGWAGVAVQRLTLVGSNSAARTDAVIAAAGVVSGLLLALAGARLQRICRSPGGPFSGR